MRPGRCGAGAAGWVCWRVGLKAGAGCSGGELADAVAAEAEHGFFADAQGLHMGGQCVQVGYGGRRAAELDASEQAAERYFALLTVGLAFKFVPDEANGVDLAGIAGLEVGLGVGWGLSAELAPLQVPAVPGAYEVASGELAGVANGPTALLQAQGGEPVKGDGADGGSGAGQGGLALWCACCRGRARDVLARRGRQWWQW